MFTSYTTHVDFSMYGFRNSGQLLFGKLTVEQLYICHALAFISKAKATPHIQLDTMQLFDTISYCGRKRQTFELIRENSS